MAIRYCMVNETGRAGRRAATLQLVITGLLPILLSLATGCSDSPTEPNLPVVFPLRHASPAWSTTDRIAYVDFGVTCINSNGSFTIDTTKAGLWILDLQDSSRFRFLSRGTFPAWTPHGDLTVADGNQLDTYAPGGQLQSTVTTTAPAVHVSWSTSGEYILWEQIVGDNGSWVAHRDTLVPRRVLTPPAYASWHPGTLSILYVGGGGSTDRTFFYEYDLLTGQRDTLFSLNLIALAPKYSPDGSRIVFSANDGLTRRTQIYTVSPTGRNLTRLTALGGSDASWSPSSLDLAYVRLDYASQHSTSNALWSLRLITHEVTQLVPAWPDPCH